ncbi:hypothetical protein NHG24_04640 [Aerococcaceae bacterium NML210727]|nr:hypothetical protein [Aerococcaceae bacterium NML210727]MCW6654469.1 hypothetical protein [Aerococcaceae bacterium NML201296]
MNKHTLGIAVIGTLASSLILGQVAQAEEVISSAEVLSPEVSEYEVDKTVHDTTNYSSTDFNTANDNETNLNVTSNGDPSFSSLANTSYSIQDENEKVNARNTYYELQRKAHLLVLFDSFWTEDSLANLKEVVYRELPELETATTQQFKEALLTLQTTLSNLQNNFNYSGSWEELLNSDTYKEAENSIEYYELMLAKEKASYLRNTKHLTPDSTYKLRGMFRLTPPIKEAIEAQTNNLNEAINQAKESPEVAEWAETIRLAEHILSSDDYLHSKEAYQLLRDALEKSYIRTVPFNDDFTLPTIEKFQFATKNLKQAIEQFKATPPVTNKKEFLIELDRAKALLKERKWEYLSYLDLKQYVNEVENYKYHSENNDMNYNYMHIILKDLNDTLIYSPEQEALSKALDFAIKEYSDKKWTEESKSALYNTIMFSGTFSGDAVQNPAEKLLELNSVMATLVPDTTIVLDTNKTQINVDSDKEIIITATINKSEETNLNLVLKPHPQFYSPIMSNEDYPTFIEPTHKEKGKLIFKIPVTSILQHYKKLEFYITLKNDDYNKLSSSLYTEVVNPLENSNSISKTSLNKIEVSHGETLRYDITFNRATPTHLDTFNVYRIGKNIPVKTITVIDKKNLYPKIGKGNREELTKDAFSYFTIDDSFVEGEYEIREGYSLRMSDGYGNFLANSDLPTYTVPQSLYQRFTVKKKVTDTDNTTSTPRQFADATTNVAVVLSDKAPKSIMKMQVVDVDEAELAKQSEWLKSVDADLFAITFVDKDGNKVVVNESAVVTMPIDAGKQVARLIHFVPETNTATDLDFKQDGNQVTFTAPHFSIYGVMYAQVAPPTEKPADTNVPNTTPVEPNKSANTTAQASTKTEGMAQADTAAKPNPNAKGDNDTSNQQTLPDTGEGNSYAVFGAAALAILAGIGLVAPTVRKDEQA